MLDHSAGEFPCAGAGISGVDNGDTPGVRWGGEEEFDRSGVDDDVDAGDGGTLAA